MAILNQETQSQFASNTRKGGLSTSTKDNTNYDNTLIKTRGQGEVINQVDPLNQSNLAPAPNAANSQSYIQQSFEQSIR